MLPKTYFTTCCERLSGAAKENGIDSIAVNFLEHHPQSTSADRSSMKTWTFDISKINLLLRKEMRIGHHHLTHIHKNIIGGYLVLSIKILRTDLSYWV